LKNLFNSGKRGWKWITLIIDESAAALGETREHIIKALTWLQEAGDIEMKPSGVRHRYRLSGDNMQHNPEQICQHMQQLFAKREIRDASRLTQIMDFAQDGTCLTRHLLRYFGEDLNADCGHCGSCLDTSVNAARNIPISPEPQITVENIARIQDLIGESHASLRAPRQVARFVCGLTSPATSRDRLKKHDAFAMLEGFPFQSVLEQTESMMP
jgi:ATP-dependent DNA helicase RecQ